MNRLELRIPPPIVFAACALGMWLAARFLPTLAVPAMPRWLAVALAIAGFLVAAAGIAAFRRAGTTTNPMTPDAASQIVTGGIYRITRNPMYLGLALVLAAWALELGNLGALALVAGFVLYMTRFQVIPEERALAARFGPAYDAYRSRVRRWL